MPISVCLPEQDTGAGGIDWGDSEAAPIEIEIVDAGTDCNYTSFFRSPLWLHNLPHAQLLTFLFAKDMCPLVGPEGVARGEDALSILENSQSRSQFIDELMEVKTQSCIVKLTLYDLYVKGHVVKIVILVLKQRKI